MEPMCNFSVRRLMLRVVVFALVASGLISTAATYATPLPVGSAILASPGAGPVGGTIVADSGPVPFVSATFTGTLHSEVIANDPANPFGPGNFTFTYLLTTTSGPDSIDRLTVPGYGIPGLLTDASYQSPVSPGAVIPTSFDRGSVATLGNVVGVSFTPVPLGSGDIPPGGSGALLHSNQYQPTQLVYCFGH